MTYPVFHVPAGDVLPVMFNTYAGSTGASVTLTGLAVTDIEIYKDGSVTQRASDAGYVLLDTDGIDFDAITGIHGFSIDTGDNTDASFYTVGAWFTVVISAVTVDAQTVNFIACQFRLMAAESVAAKPKVDVDAWLGTAAATPTVAGVPEVDITHVAGATTDVSALATNVAAILVDTGTTLDARIPAALVGGRMDASVGAMAANVITAAATAADFATEVRAVASGTADSGTTTTMVDAARTEADTDYWVGGLIVFTSGTISGQARYITGFVPATDTITFAPATTLAVGTHTYEIWPTADFLRPTTTGRTLDVSAGGEAGVDWANVGSPTTTLGLTNTTVGVLTTYTGNTPQTGDSFARIGVAGAGLTNIDLPDQTMNITGNLTGNVSGSVGSVTGAVGSVTAGVTVANGGIATTSFAAGAIDDAALAASAGAELADAFLNRNMATGTDSGTDSTAVRTPRQALRALRNKVSVSAGTATVTKEDDVTASWTTVIATTPGNPVSSSDPS